MANIINYAEKWFKPLIQFIQQDIIVADHITTDVEWGKGKTFHFTINKTSGYKDHNRNGGWNRGDLTQTDVPYTLDHDRDVEFFVDKADVDESNETASAENVTNTFMITQANPEMDAYFFSSVSSNVGAVITQGDIVGTTITETNVVKFLKSKIKPLRRYGTANIRGYVSSDVMELLELAEDFKKDIKIQVVNTNGNTDGGNAVETRITNLDGVKLIEVFDTDRFYDSFDFDDGFTPVVGVSRPLNCLFCTVTHTKLVPKINSIYLKNPEQHSQGDGYLYQNRTLFDTVTFPNGKTGDVDSITGSSGVLVQ